MLVVSASCASVNAERKPTAEPAPHAAELLSGTPAAFAASCDAEIAAVKAALGQARTATSSAAVLEHFDEALQRLENAGLRAVLAKEVHPDVKFREVAEACEPRASTLSVELSQDRTLYDPLNAIDAAALDAEASYWLGKTLIDFRRSGVDRDQATRAKVAALNEELVKIAQAFDRNIREDVRTLKVAPGELDGVPADWLKAHPVVDGKVSITTDSPDAVPVLTYAKSAAVREALWRLNRNRGYPGNVEVLNTLLAKRYGLATLLGYASYAAYDTQVRMVKTADAAAEFIEKGRLATEKRANADSATLLARKRKDTPAATSIDPWDLGYYIDRVQTEQYSLDSQKLREYFEYGHVRDGVIGIASDLFGVRFQRIDDAKVWHASVETYDVFEGERLLGRIHLDMHPREGKYKHAAHFAMTAGGRDALPEASLVCNFAEAGGFLEHRDVETFFHEFGHMMHNIFSARHHWASAAGLKMEWDFVEAPSMLLQEFALDGPTLQRFAKHFKTNEPIPPALVGQLVAAKEFGIGVYARRQFFLAAISLEYHRRAPGFDTTAVLRELQDRFSPIKEWVEGTHFELSFGHLSSYGSTYYTYLWSTVIAKDLLTRFHATSMLDPKVAREYRTKILEPGGARPAQVSVTDFLGRPSSFDAFEKWLNTPHQAPTP